MALKTVERLGDLLDLFTPERTEWTLVDVARALDVPRSTAHGLLVSVASTGILQAMGNGRYRLGPRIAALNVVQMQQRELRLQQAGSEVLRRLANETWETSNLGILAGPVIVYIDTIPGRHHVTVTGAHPGTRLGAARTAIGKVLIAHRSPEGPARGDAGSAPRALLPSELSAREVKAIRRNGVAYDLGEVSPEVRCVAVPVWDTDGAAVAALSLSTTTARFDRNHDRLIEPLKAASVELTRRLGVLDRGAAATA